MLIFHNHHMTLTEIVFSLTQEFSKIVEKHAPLRKKFIRGKHANFMNNKLRKAIYTRSFS